MIYILTNLITGLSYVGKTSKTLDERWDRHIADAFRNVNTVLYRAIKGYGPEAFVREVICECSDEEADDLERFCITAFNTRHPSGYNMTDGGDGCPGYVFTEEDRKKLGSGLRGKKRPPRSDVWKQRLSASGKGRRTWNKGLPVKDSTKAKLSALGKDRVSRPEFVQLLSDRVKEAISRPETQEKIAAEMKRRRENGWSEKMSVRSASPEWKKKQKEGCKKRSQSPEWKEWHAKLMASPEYREKLSKAQKLRAARERFERYLMQAPPEFLVSE